MSKSLQDSVINIKGVGPKLATILNANGICTIEDVLDILPKRYEDRRKIFNISELTDGIRATIAGTIDKALISYYTKTKKRVFHVIVKDDSGSVLLKWFKFNYSYVQNVFLKGKRIVVTGKIREFQGGLEYIHPDVEIIGKFADNWDLIKKIIPIYSEVHGIYPKVLRKIVREVIQSYYDILPQDFKKSDDFRNIPLREALREIHLPKNDNNVDEFNLRISPYHKRFIYNELYSYLKRVKENIKLRKNCNVPLISTSELIETEIENRLPFKLTKSQLNVLSDIKYDFTKNYPAKRLIQGDVGCGKTAIALISAYFAVKSGFQVALMAPTSILSDQLFCFFDKYFSQIDISVIHLSSKTKEKNKIYEMVENGKIDIIIGTSALLSASLNFKKLGLIIIDEQHKFGAKQRMTLIEKSQDSKPHAIAMTATPIPRSLALTIFADYDISRIDELPFGNFSVQTKIINQKRREEIYKYIKTRIEKGERTYIIYPVIDENEDDDIFDLETSFLKLSDEIFKDYKIGMVHGRMKNKDEVMNNFREGKIDVLVATPLIEIGIDVPSATTIVIENPEKYGLAQLHQMRGRVGRGGRNGICFLIIHDNLQNHSIDRINYFKNVTDGLMLAEYDLKSRGPGELIGYNQSGFPKFAFADIFRNWDILLMAKNDLDTEG